MAEVVLHGGDEGAPERSQDFLADYANWEGLRSVCLTVDVDFAPDYMIDYSVAILEEYDAAATIFATHDSPTVRTLAAGTRYEIGLHPNLSENSSHGSGTENVLGHLHAMFPLAVGNRFHRLSSAYPDLAALRKVGAEYDVSRLMLNTPFLLPAWHPDLDLTLMPYSWEDGTWEATGLPMTAWEIDLDSPGIKILNFHPVNLYLNACDTSTRMRLKAAHPDLLSLRRGDADAYRQAGPGAESILRELLALLSSRGCRTVHAVDIARAHRAWVGVGRPLAPPRVGTATNGASQRPRVSHRAAQLHSLTDANAQISAQVPSDIVRLRARLVGALWGDESPTKSASVSSNNAGLGSSLWPRRDGHLSACEELTVSLDFGMVSSVQVLRASRPNGTLVLLHHGHTSAPELRSVATLLERGYDVAALWMPFCGPNSEPIEVEIPRIGTVVLQRHDDLALLRPLHLAGSPIRLFLEPTLAILDHLTALGGHDRFAMLGVSGGGWATTLCAAIDPRIARSYPVAGTLPHWLRVGMPDWPTGDYEENDPDLYASVTHLEMYVLGSHGRGRGQLQVLNRYDNRCFGGLRHRFYADAVAARVNQLGYGRFDVLLDESHRRHALSAAALDVIVANMEND